jgi:hypothetical protein
VLACSPIFSTPVQHFRQKRLLFLPHHSDVRVLILQSSENTTLLERLEATQEKCVAEVDFTRHVLICKLQRLENKLEDSLSTIDYNNNNTLTDEKGRSIEEIRDEMSKEYRDLRKLLQETSTQLKQVLDEKINVEINEEGDKSDGGTLEGKFSPSHVEETTTSPTMTINYIWHLHVHISVILLILMRLHSSQG